MTATSAPRATVLPSSAPSPALAPPPGNPRFALFDSLRAVAILLIIAFHVATITGFLASGVAGDAITVLGPQSLMLFFIISGFLLYRPFVSARARGRPVPSIARYGRRRALRIVPGYWTALTLLAVFPGIVGVFTGHWWRYYGFLQVYSPASATQGIPVAWSLCVEATYYLGLPVWVLAARRWRLGSGPRAWVRAELAALAAVAAAGIAVRVLAARNVLSDTLATTLLGQSPWLALGMALAVVSVAVQHAETVPRTVDAIRRHPGLCWLGSLGALVALIAVTRPHGLAGILQSISVRQSAVRTVAEILIAALMHVLFVLPAIFGENAGGLPRRFLAMRPLAWLGVVSYGMFLYHLTVAEFIAQPSDPQHFSASGLGLLPHLHHVPTAILYVLTVAVTMVLAAASYHLVELPFLRRKERGR